MHGAMSIISLAKTKFSQLAAVDDSDKVLRVQCLLAARRSSSHMAGNKGLQISCTAL